MEMVEEGDGFFNSFARNNEHKYKQPKKLRDDACKFARFQSYRHYHFSFGTGDAGACTPLPLCVEQHIKKNYRYSYKGAVGFKTTELRAKEAAKKMRKALQDTKKAAEKK